MGALRDCLTESWAVGTRGLRFSSAPITLSDARSDLLPAKFCDASHLSAPAILRVAAQARVVSVPSVRSQQKQLVARLLD